MQLVDMTYTSQPAVEEYGENPVLADGVLHRLNQVLFWNSSLLEEFLHQLVISHRDQFDQLLVGLLRSIFQIVWNFAVLALAVSAQLVGTGFHSHQVHYAGEILLATDLQLQRCNGAPKSLGE